MKNDNKPSAQIMPLTGNWTTECAVCGNHYQNGCGSTECCGAVQYLIDPESDATTGRRTLSPEAEASIQRIATHALTAAEAAAIRQIDASLKVEPSGKEPSPAQP